MAVVEAYAAPRDEDLIAACRESLKEAAAPYRAKDVVVTAIAPIERHRRLNVARLEARISYGLNQTRRSRITCWLSGEGAVLAFR
jgi:hypothetical protein